MRTSVSRSHYSSQLSLVFFLMIGLITIFTLQTLQAELIKMSKSVVPAEDGTLAGKLQYFSVWLRDWYHSLPTYCRDLIWSLHTKYLYFIVPFILFLEYLTPCNQDQPFFSTGFFQDAIWFVIRLIFDPLLICISFVYIKGIYDEHLSFLTIHALLSWPLAIQILLALFLSDFFIWTYHSLAHKTKVLWLFHAVHHSQEEMNLFTGDRAHPLDTLAERLITTIPLLMFQTPALPALPLIWMIKSLWQRLIHANVKIDFGWLHYLLVTPQFHRIHHSRETRHHGKNFGSFFSLWDHLFGTAYHCTSEYPDTGIADAAFPCEQRFRKSQLLLSTCLQIAYPLKQLASDWTKVKLKLSRIFMLTVPNKVEIEIN